LREISLHIMDIAENGITAGANCINIRVVESRTKNFLEILIKDNGKGITEGSVIGTSSNSFLISRVSSKNSFSSIKCRYTKSTSWLPAIIVDSVAAISPRGALSIWSC